MNPRMRWLSGFVKWFFNASPFWVDERKIWKPSADCEYGDRREHRRDDNECASSIFDA